MTSPPSSTPRCPDRKFNSAHAIPPSAARENGGRGWESNPPGDFVGPPSGFEVQRGSAQATSGAELTHARFAWSPVRSPIVYRGGAPWRSFEAVDCLTSRTFRQVLGVSLGGLQRAVSCQPSNGRQRRATLRQTGAESVAQIVQPHRWETSPPRNGLEAARHARLIQGPQFSEDRRGLVQRDRRAASSLLRQRGHHGPRQWDIANVVVLAASDHDRLSAKVHVLPEQRQVEMIF